MQWLLAKSFFGLPRLLWAGLGALAVLAALVWGAHALYQDIKQSGRDEIQAQWDAEKSGRETQRAEMNADLTNAISGIGDGLHTVVNGITKQRHEITSRIKLEMANDPRYTDPACFITGGVRDHLNTVSRLSDPHTAPRGREGDVPGFEPAVRIDLGSTN